MELLMTLQIFPARKCFRTFRHDTAFVGTFASVIPSYMFDQGSFSSKKFGTLRTWELVQSDSRYVAGHLEL